MQELEPFFMSEPMTRKESCCPECGGEMIQKSKTRLLSVGICLMASIGVAFFVPLFWSPGIVLVLTGIYLVVWATLGRTRWCRSCKKFNIAR